MTHFGIFGHSFNTGGILTGSNPNPPSATQQGVATSDFVSSGDSTKAIINISDALQNLPNAFQQAGNIGQLAQNQADIINVIKGNFSGSTTGKATIDNQPPPPPTASGAPILDQIKQPFEDKGIPFGIGAAVAIGAIFLIARR